jgi:hypothetical protein
VPEPLANQPGGLHESFGFYARIAPRTPFKRMTPTWRTAAGIAMDQWRMLLHSILESKPRRARLQFHEGFRTSNLPYGGCMHSIRSSRTLSTMKMALRLHLPLTLDSFKVIRRLDVRTTPDPRAGRHSHHGLGLDACGRR